MKYCNYFLNLEIDDLQIQRVRDSNLTDSVQVVTILIHSFLVLKIAGNLFESA